MAKKKSTFKETQGKAYNPPFAQVIQAAKGRNLPPASSQALAPLTRKLADKLIKDGRVTEEYYQAAKASGMTHFNYRTGNFAMAI